MMSANEHCETNLCRLMTSFWIILPNILGIRRIQQEHREILRDDRRDTLQELSTEILTRWGPIVTMVYGIYNYS